MFAEYVRGICSMEHSSENIRWAIHRTIFIANYSLGCSSESIPIRTMNINRTISNRHLPSHFRHQNASDSKQHRCNRAAIIAANFAVIDYICLTRLIARSIRRLTDSPNLTNLEHFSELINPRRCEFRGYSLISATDHRLLGDQARPRNGCRAEWRIRLSFSLVSQPENH